MTSAIRDQALAGRRILVTGAANGIGRATAAAMVAAGAHVALLDRDGEGVAAAALAMKMPGVACDVREPASVTRAVSEAEAALGGLDGLVNAAGIFLHSRLTDMQLEDWDRVMQVNLTGPYLVCRAAAPALLRAGGGTIANIASIGAMRPAAGVSAYAASKAGLVMFGKCLAIELGPTVRVNTVCPGTIETAMSEGLLGDAAVRRRLTEAPALGRLGRPDDIAQAVLYLSSDGASYVNGATLVVDGGYAWV